MKNALRHIILLAMLSVTDVVAQTKIVDCEAKLQFAKTEFNKGRFSGLFKILSSCLERDFTEEQKFRAYYILTEAYLIMGQNEEASKAYLELLKADVDFVPSVRKDPIDIVYLGKRFTAAPIVEYYFTIAPTLNRFVGLNERSLSPYPLSTKISTRIGLEGGVGINYNIQKKLALGAEINIVYRQNMMGLDGLFGNDALRVSSTAYLINLPLLIKYSLYTRKRFYPYVYLGAAIDFKILESAAFIATDNSYYGYNENNPLASIFYNSNEISLTHARKRFIYSALAGIGLRYKLKKKMMLFTDLRLRYGLNNEVVVKNNYYEDASRTHLNPAATGFAWISPDFLNVSLAWTIGICISVHKPRLLPKK